ncbi:SDR family NAD(P)-dependent oxidoreductase [Granulicella arctica]|uniref:SDR family NAD(P)-dependent oxidoreductase n=1 Tax=Granulicella arctica TaxID=940613 RepID=UPI0021E0E1AE|nr:glucose 1-dehydrogenase [Granulicella arctica]
MKVLEGKNALVTGASKGIGAAIAKCLAEAGASVVVNYASDKTGADLVVAEIMGKGGKGVAIQADISKASEAKRLVTETVTALGSLDILVNNAGVYSFGPLELVTEEEFHRQFNTNVLGLLTVTQEAVKHLKGSGGGSIINIGTAASQTGSPNMVLYLATKSGVDSVTRVLSKELGPKKIRVNSINPGGTDTEGARALGVIGSDFEKHIIAQTPLGRFGQPDDVAPVAVFLASDASRWLTGEIIHASGGAR